MPGNTQQIFQFNNDLAPTFSNLTVSGDYLLFVAGPPNTGREPFWMSINSPAVFGAWDLIFGNAGSAPTQIVTMNDKAYCAGLTNAGTIHLYELQVGAPWGASDLVVAANLTLNLGLVPNLAVVPGADGTSTTLYFSAIGDHGEELYFYRPATGIQFIEDINPDIPAGALLVPQNSTPRLLTAAGGRLFFSANDGANGRELWRSDGTAAGTFILTNLNQQGDSNPSGLKTRPDDQTLFFALTGGTGVSRLWQSQGQMADTVAVPDAMGYSHQNPSNLSFSQGEDLFFSSQGSFNGADLGREPWVYRDPGFLLGDRIWDDRNANGIQDPLELGIAGVTIRMLDSLDNEVDSTVTNSLGVYAFGGTGPGIFRIEIDAPSGMIFSPKDQGFDDNLDSDVTSSGRSELYTLANNDVLLSLDAGLTDFSLSISDVTITEGNTGTTNAVFTVSLSTPCPVAVTVDYNTANGSATSPSDYAFTSGTLTFSPTETSKTLTVPVVGDTKYEFNENFFVNLSNAVNAGIADSQGIGTILNDDAVPTIVIGDVTNIEGNSGTVSYNFPVTLSHTSEPDVTVAYATTAGTAGSPGDYTAISGTLTFVEGQTSMFISALVNGDLDEENHETFSMSLSSPVNGTFGDSSGLGTIRNDDTSISIQDTSVSETSSATFSLVLSKPSALSVTVSYNTADGTALTGSDYTTTSGSVTFNPEQVSKTVTVGLIDNTVYEPTENFFVNLSSPTNAAIADSQGQGTILDNEQQPTISIWSMPFVFVPEGNSGTTTFSFSVSLSNASSQSVSMDYASADGTATAGSDYQATSGTLTFAPLETSKTIEVTIYGDTTVEDMESFVMNLSNAVNATFFNTSATGNIENDD